MQNKLRNFFYKDIAIKLSTIEVCILICVNIFFKFTLGMYAHMIVDIALVACIIALYVGFNNHNKNLQKGMLGAVLMWYFYDEILYVVDSIILNKSVLVDYYGFAGMTYIVITLIMLVIYALFFVNYFIISGDHYSNRKGIMINHILVITLAVLSIISMIAQVQVITSTVQIVEVVTWQLAFSIFILMIAAYETHFDEYRSDREEAGWTIKKGYPEGYVHQFEKKNKD